MKRISFLVIFFMACSAALFSQQPIKFLDIDWGTSGEKLVSIMQEKGFSVFYADGEKSIDCKGPLAGGIGDITLDLYKNQFYEAMIILDTYIPVKEIASILADKYGPPTSSYDDYMLSLYVWDFLEKGKLSISKSSNLLILEYVDGGISVQKKRDELSGL
jgi:hypothetical protein